MPAQKAPRTGSFKSHRDTSNGGEEDEGRTKSRFKSHRDTSNVRRPGYKSRHQAVSNPIGILQTHTTERRTLIIAVSNPIGILQTRSRLSRSTTHAVSNPIGILQTISSVLSEMLSTSFKSHRDTSNFRYANSFLGFFSVSNPIGILQTQKHTHLLSVDIVSNPIGILQTE